MKSQTVTVKPATNVLNIKATKGFDITINGKPVYKHTPPAPIEQFIYAKDYTDPFAAFNAAIAKELPCIVDSLVINATNAKQLLSGNIVVMAAPGQRGTITFNFEETTAVEMYGLVLAAGQHNFINIDFVCGHQNSSGVGSAFQTLQDNITYHNNFSNCTFTGPFRYNYQSSAGHGSTTFTNCNLFAVHTNIQYYSQMGSKLLTMKDCTVQSLDSHNIYTHAWNNYDISGLVSLGCGINVFNSYYTNNTGNYTSSYQSFKHCKNAEGAISKQTNNEPMWRLQSVGCRVTVEKCKLPVYEWNKDFDIIDSNITNQGNGTPIYGNSAALRCTGELTVMDKMHVLDCNLTRITGNNNSELKAVHSSITYGSIKENCQATFIDCNFQDFDIAANNSRVTFTRCKFNSQYKAIRIFGSSAPPTFIDCEYPVLVMP